MTPGQWVAVTAITLIIGLRFQVGGDWGPYLGLFEEAGRASPRDLLTFTSPSYQLLNWGSYQLGLGIYGVNLACGLIFATGLISLCKTLPRPWLALAVSIPYLITVVAMGYTRQSVAIGLLMLAANFLMRNKVFTSGLLVAIAATFHTTIIILIGFLIFSLRGMLFFVVAPAVLFLLVIVWVLMGDVFLLLYKNYVISEYQSSGAVVRTAMTALPATVFLLYRSRFLLPMPARRFWSVMSFAAIALFLLTLVSSATVALDRIALYFLPIQLLVAAYLPDIFNFTAQSKKIIKSLIVAGYGIIYSVWLGFAAHAPAWIPYQNALWQ